MDEKYWEFFYKNNNETEPSLFAKYVLHTFLNKEDNLIELGCGNGRDAIFFIKKGIKITAVDQCFIPQLKLMSEQQMSLLNYLNADFTNLGYLGIFTGVYSRFSLHTITEVQENNVIDWAYNSLEKRGRLYIEARSIKNELYKKGDIVNGESNAYIYDEHYRRFVEKEILCEKLEKTGFNILINLEDIGFAPYKNSNQTFLRIIAEK